MKKSICAFLLACSMALISPAMAQQTGGAALRGHAMKVLNQQPLTLETARNAVDSLILLREKYKDHKFKGKADGPAGVIEGMKNSKVSKDIQADLKKYGFSSIDDWVTTFMSVGLAVSYVQRDMDSRMKKKIAEIKQNTEMPEILKKRLLDMLTAMIPPKGNAAIARQLLDDPGYAAKLKTLIRHRKPRQGAQKKPAN